MIEALLINKKKTYGHFYAASSRVIFLFLDGFRRPKALPESCLG